MAISHKPAVVAALIAGITCLGFAQDGLAKEPAATLGAPGSGKAVRKVPADIQKLIEKSRHWDREATKAGKQVRDTGMQIAVLEARISQLRRELKDPAKAGIARALRIAIDSARADRAALLKVKRSQFTSMLAAWAHKHEAETALNRAGYRKLPRDWWRRPAINLGPKQAGPQQPQRGKGLRAAIARQMERTAARLSGTWTLHENGHIKVANWPPHKGMVLRIQNDGKALTGTLIATNGASRQRGWTTGMTLLRVPLAKLAFLRRYGQGWKYGGNARTRQGGWKATDTALVLHDSGELEIDQFWTYRFRK